MATTMVLGAARCLAKRAISQARCTSSFSHAEGGGGSRVMCEGLFKRFDCDHIFAVHNRPDLQLDKWGTRVGPFMAAADSFTIEITGRGSGHAARPHLLTIRWCRCQSILAAQTIVSRNVNPLELR